ncbi:MAG TPA: protein kinase [Candidatus Polarisedimenticolia bacterium]|nr:protein kinase [Candidatus Polarisedimenticolia bacterium]
MPLEPGQRLSHYRLIEKIGQGGMGLVFKALDTSLNREVALKVLPDDMASNADRLSRFEREARAVAALNHPGIVTIHSVEQDQGVRFFTMELVEGETLEGLMTPQGLPLTRLLDLALPLIDAVAAAHEHGVIHRDLKPANVMVSREGRVKVLDFGLAKLAAASEDEAGDSSEQTQTLTRLGQVLGTLTYMSPEQAQGKSPDHRSDLFSLGVILYEMATGRRPFTGASRADLVSSLLRDTPSPVSSSRSGLPRRLDEIIGRCLEKDPARRYQSARELHADLAGLASGSTQPTGAVAGAGGAWRRHWKLALAVVLVGSAVVESGLVIWRRPSQRSSEVRPPTIPSAPITSVATQAGRAPARSIAVLPFVNMSAEKETEYFSDGITEELINALAKVKDLKVPARTSVYALSGKDLGIQEIGQRLGVETVLEGSVRRSGDQLRITAQLINVTDGYHMWSERYDRKMADVFAIQDEIAASIVSALELRLSPGETQALAGPPTTDVRAYDYYLRGRQYFHRGGKKNYDFAREMFAKAIEIDPGFARAHAGIADISSFTYMYMNSSPEVLRRAEEASRKALELVPNSAEAHASRGLALSLTNQHEEAERQFEEAIRLDPRLFEPYYFYARDCFTQGKMEKAEMLFRKAAEARPEDFQSRMLRLGVLEALHRPKEELMPVAQEAIQVAQNHLALNPDDVRALYMTGNALVSIGERERGLELAAKALAVDPNDTSILYNVACLYSVARMRDEAVDTLTKAVAAGFNQKSWIEKDADFDFIRDDPRYKALLDSMK